MASGPPVAQAAPPLDGFLARLAQFASTSPDHPALVDSERSLSYGQLVDEVEEKAAALMSGGIEPGHRVALVAENSANFLVYAFAVWRVGAVLVTVYPTSSVSDMAYCLERSDPSIVLADSSTLESVQAAVHPDLGVGLIDGSTPALRARTGRMPNPEDVARTLTAIFFTSGTTNRPKAIMESKQGLLEAARVYSEVWHLDQTTRTIVALPMAWAYGLNTTSMATLYAGGRVIVLRRAKPELLLDGIARQGATFLPGVTTMFVKMVQALESGGPSIDFSSLRFCLSAGEPRNEAAFKRWTELTGVPVHDNFCATECYPVITYDPISDPVPLTGSAGKVVEGSSMRVVDPTGDDVADGDVGEALWRAPNTMLGYWRDEEQTAAAFTADGWYHSKDLVSVDERGYVFVRGRLSDMIIRGGNNVSPAEVERVLSEHPNIRAAAAVGLPDPEYGQEVVAALVVADVSNFNESDVVSFVAGQLAAYKVPSRFVLVDELPLNSTTGKVDRRAVAASFDAPGVQP
jgi:long-chain acyl-CoA synthetase